MIFIITSLCTAALQAKHGVKPNGILECEIVLETEHRASMTQRST
jgi:hypothetical protein